jgi:hypothetical protein
LAVAVVQPRPEPGEILEGARGLQLLDGRSPRAFIVSVLTIARCISTPTSAIWSPTSVAASEIRTWASAAEYWALLTPVLGTEFLGRSLQLFLGPRPESPRERSPEGRESQGDPHPMASASVPFIGASRGVLMGGITDAGYPPPGHDDKRRRRMKRPP